jgi:nucleotide-binding universal stress UspA family protein
MNNTRTILCAVADDDCREHVLATGTDLATATGLPLVFAHVAGVDFPSAAATVVPGGPGIGWAPFREGHYREAQRRAVERGREFLARFGVPEHAAKVRAGHPPAELEEVADEVRAEAIVVGWHGGGVLKTAAEGVGRSLAIRGDRPVVFARSQANVLAASGPVVCGVAPDEPGAPRVVAAAGRFAARLRRGLAIVHVGARSGRLDGLRDLVPAGVATDVVVDDGNVAERLCWQADARNAGLLVVGCRGRGALRRVLAGSVSLALTDVARQPVMVVPTRPD